MTDAPTPQRAASAEERTRLVDASSFVLLKRGLFWRPNCWGYTGILSEAGRYSEEDARSHAAGDGVTYMPACEAPKFSPACWEDVKLKVVERELAEALDRITAAEARAEEAREEAADAVSQLDAWFDTKARADTDLGPAFKDAIGGFLRTSRCGGMPTKLSDQIEAVLNRFIDLNAGRIVAPIIEAIVTERTEAATTDRDRLAAEVARLRGALDQIAKPILHMQREMPEGYQFDGRVALTLITPDYLQGIAARALTATGA